MNSIEQRVLQMQFDNAQFEKGIRTSTESLEKFEKTLELSNATKGLSEIEKSIRGFSFSALQTGIETVSSRFTNLGIVGVTTLQNITNSAVNCGKTLIKSLTVDPVTTGLTEYETKMNAITTILTNTQDKGTTLDDVNKALSELNDYADQTIYNFAEMTRNIGTFTAAGVDLETSTKAIKGIANLAAGSGSSAQQASTAMYQLSQALAAGKVSLQDWNSVVNAGMGGQLFQNALKETAKQMGIVVDESVSFRDSISASGGNETWLTSDVLLKTLEKFAEDETLVKAATQVKTFTQLLDTMKESVQSGWAVSWEYIIGDREEAITLLTGISNAFNDLIGPSTDARNEMLRFWNENGGRQAVIDGLANSFKFLGSVLTPIGTAFRKLFPPTTGAQLTDISNRFLAFTEKLKVSDRTLQNIGTTFEGFFSILKLGEKAIITMGKALASFLGYLAPMGGGLFEFTASLGSFFIRLNEAENATDAFNRAFVSVQNVLAPAAEFASAAISALTDALSAFSKVSVEGIENSADRLAKRLEPFGLLGDIFTKAFTSITGVLKTVSGGFLVASSKVAEGVNGIAESFSGLNVSTGLDILNSGILALLGKALYQFINNLSDVTTDAKGFIDSFKNILDGVGGSLEAFQGRLKADTLLRISASIAILAASLLVLSTIDSDKLTDALAAITVLFGELYAMMTGFNKVASGGGFSSMGKLTVGMIGLSTAMVILSAAVKNLASLSWEELVKGLTGVAVLLPLMTRSVKSLSANGGSMVKGSVGLIALAGAIRILTESVEVLAGLDVAGLTKGLAGVGTLLGELALFSRISSVGGAGLAKSIGFIALATAIRILAESVEVFAAIDIAGLVKGLIATGIILGEIAIFTKLTGNASKVVSTAVGLNLLAASMLIFGQAISRIGELSIETIGKGLLSMAGVLAEMAIALNFMPKNLIGTGTGLIAVATAIVILEKAFSGFAELDLEAIGRGMLALGGSLAVIAIGLRAMNGAIGGAVAITVFAAALAILTPMLKILSGMKLEGIITALGTLAATFTILGVAGTLLTPLIPSIFALAGSIALLGVGVTAVGAGVLLLATGLTALGVAGTTGVAALVLAISSIIGLIPMFLSQVGAGIVAFASVIANGAPAIVNAAVAVAMSLLQAINTLAPEIVDTAVGVILLLLTTIAENTPEFVQAGFDILIGFLSGIRDNTRPIVDVGVDIIINLVDGIVAKLPLIVDTAFDVIIAFMDALGTAFHERAPELIDAAFDLAGDILQGLIEGLMAGVTGAVDAIIGVGESMLNGLKNFFGIASPSKVMRENALYLIKGIVAGLAGGTPEAVKSIVGVGKDLLSGFQDVLGIHSPSVVFNQQGHYIVRGLADGISSDMSAVDAAKQLAQNIVSAFKTELDRIDLDQNTLELEYELWEKTSGKNASSIEKMAAKTELLISKLQNEALSVQQANAEYTATMKAFGPDAEETQEAYNKYLQAQIDMSELSEQVVEAQTSLKEAQDSAMKNYYKYLNENQANLLAFGVSLEEIEQAARSESGYDPNFKGVSDIDAALKEAAETAAKVVSVTLDTQLSSITSTVSQKMTSTGAEASKSLSNGLASGSDQMSKSVVSASDSAVSAILNTKDKWTSAGYTLASVLAQGIQNGGSLVVSAAESIARKAASAASSILDITVSTASSQTFSGLEKTISGINDAVSSEANLSPTITPVMDLSQVQSGIKSLNGLVSPITRGFNLVGSVAKAAFTASTTNATRSSESKNPSDKTVVNNFTQNNYSPKALSQLEIYRQTKNQFAMTKEMVTTK